MERRHGSPTDLGFFFFVFPAAYARTGIAQNKANDDRMRQSLL